MTEGVDLGASCCPVGRLKHRHDRLPSTTPAHGTSPRWVRTGQMRAGARSSRAPSSGHAATACVRRDDPLPPTMAMTFDDFAPHEDDPWGDRRALGRTGRGACGARSSASIRGSLRIGAVALAGVLMIPLALALREDADEGLRSETLAATDSTTATTARGVSDDGADRAGDRRGDRARGRRRTRDRRGHSAADGEPRAGRAGRGRCRARSAPARYTVIVNDYWNRFPKTSGASVEEWLEANDATPTRRSTSATSCASRPAPGAGPATAPHHASRRWPPQPRRPRRPPRRRHLRRRPLPS